MAEYNNPFEGMSALQRMAYGFGLGKESTSKFWIQACEKWLKSNALIKI